MIIIIQIIEPLLKSSSSWPVLAYPSPLLAQSTALAYMQFPTTSGQEHLVINKMLIHNFLTFRTYKLIESTHFLLMVTYGDGESRKDEKNSVGISTMRR